jgi:hypothetical protein
MTLSKEERKQIADATDLLAGSWSAEIRDGLFHRMVDMAEARPTSGYAASDHFTASLVALGDFCRLMAKIRNNRSRTLNRERPRE